MPLNMNWDDLRIVCAVYRFGSFLRAAREIAVDETTVARRLARIETALGRRLFDTVDGIRSPTEACQAMLPSLLAMEKAAHDVRALTESGNEPLRKFRLATIPAIAEHFIAPAVPALLAAEPGLALIIDTGDHNVDMSRWEADLAIRLGRPSRGAFNMRRVGLLDFHLVCPKRLAATSGGRRARNRLEADALIAYPDSLAEMPEMVTLLRMEKSRPVRVQTSDIGLIRALLAEGVGIGVLPGFALGPLRGDDRLEIHRLEAHREVWLLTQSHSRDDPLAKRLAAWCASLFNPR